MEWISIEKAALKPKKGFFRLYSYAPSTNQRYVLSRIYTIDSYFGSRLCDYYMDIPIIETQPQTD